MQWMQCLPLSLVLSTQTQVHPLFQENRKEEVFSNTCRAFPMLWMHLWMQLETAGSSVPALVFRVIIHSTVRLWDFHWHFS
jgi:hypothetical protein